MNKDGRLGHWYKQCLRFTLVKCEPMSFPSVKNHSVVTFKRTIISILSPSIDTFSVSARNDIKGGSVKLMFSDENVVLLISFVLLTWSLQSALLVAYVVPVFSIPDFFVGSSSSEPTSESVSFMDFFQDIGFRWTKLHLYAQQSFIFVPSVVDIIQKSR